MDRVLEIQSNVFGNKEIRLLADHLSGASTNRGTIVDLGCGGGHFTLKVAKQYPGAHIVGLDNNTDMLELCKKRIASGDVSNVTVYRCDIKDRIVSKYICEADVVYARYTLQHLRNCGEYLRRICEFMKKGSIIICIEAVYPFYGEIPSGGTFTKYIENNRKAYDAVGSEFNMGLLLPKLLSEAGFNKIDTKIAFYNNFELGGEFTELVMNTAMFVNKMEPKIMTVEFIGQLERYMRDKSRSVHIFKSTSVTKANKRG